MGGVENRFLAVSPEFSVPTSYGANGALLYQRAVRPAAANWRLAEHSLSLSQLFAGMAVK